MYVPIVMEDKSINFYDEQQHNNDTVFNTRNIHTRASYGNYINNDKDYKKQDRGQYIFSTMGNNLTAMFSNNMAIPIRSKPTLNGHHMYAKIMEHADSVDDGVYIVDYYNMYNDGTTSVENVMLYYLNSTNIEYDRNTIENIVNKITGKNGRQFPTEVSIRLITFIPAKVINEHMNVYVDRSDILIIKGVVNNSIVHPNSRKYKENDTKTIKAHNAIEIEIVDNINNEPYYIKLGNKVEKFMPTKDISRTNGARLKIYKNGSITTSEKSNLTNLSDTFGFFRTKKEAESNGDVSKLAELDKLNVEKQKISLELDKIAHEKIKLKEERDFYREKFKHEIAMQEQKFKIGQLDIMKKEEEITMAYYKAELEIGMSTHKHTLEANAAVIKSTMEQAKSNTDFIFKTVITASKFI